MGAREPLQKYLARCKIIVSVSSATFDSDFVSEAEPDPIPINVHTEGWPLGGAKNARFGIYGVFDWIGHETEVGQRRLQDTWPADSEVLPKPEGKALAREALLEVQQAFSKR